MQEKKYKTFWSFYPFYLSEHKNSRNRRLHFIGTLLIFICIVTGIVTGRWFWLILIPVVGYGFAWFGHFFFEKNKPATFSYPLYSLGSDFVMFWHTITGELDKKMKQAGPSPPTNISPEASTEAPSRKEGSPSPRADI